MKNKRPEFYNHMSPDHIPHYHDWPHAPHTDWPHSMHHRWNDSEPANIVPWDWNCCHPEDDDCICVTSADAELWNSYSGLSGLTAFDPEALSAAFSALENMSDYEEVRDGYDFMSANSAVWQSAGYVPNIYDNLSALYNAVNDKVDYSAFSAFHVWTDSEKIAHQTGAYGNFSGTIVGVGTYDRPLRVSKEISKGIDSVYLATKDLTIPLANQDDLDVFNDDILALDKRTRSISGDVGVLRDEIKALINTWADGKPTWINKKPSKKESKENPSIFYYWTSK